MKRTLIQLAVVVSLAAGLLVPVQAHAWGPRAMRAIVAMSLQMNKQNYPSVFRPGGAEEYSPGLPHSATLGTQCP